ncbi:MAG: hypothetical protein M3500_03250 [Actinomycetota bacterium]|nr:hypothetical protein [Actinomycetota bacterium]
MTGAPAHYAEQDLDSEVSGALRELVVVRSGQRVVNEIVAAYLQRLEFGDDGYARLIHLPATRSLTWS